MRRLRVRSLYHRAHIKKLRRLQRSGQACVARWAIILVLSHQGRSVHAPRIAAGMGLPVQTVRTRIRRFNGAERAARWDRWRPPRRPCRTPTYGPAVQQGWVDLLKPSPEQFGLDSGAWRLHDLVTVAKRTRLVTGPARRTFNVETVRRLLRKAGYVYLSAKWWITSDDPHYAHKKARRDAILAWAKRDPSLRVVFQDESWFSGTPKAVGQYGQRGQPRTAAVEKPAHQCKGAWLLSAARDVLTGRVQRFYAPRCNPTDGRQQLEDLLTQAQAAGKRVLVVTLAPAASADVWDNASWHTAQALRRWYYRYNQTAKRTGQVRLLRVALPSRSPWLNPIEPVFGQAKRHIVGRRSIPQPSRLKRKTESYFQRRDTRLARKAVHPTAQT